VIGERPRIVVSEGKELVVEVNSGPIRDRDGKIVAAVAVFSDVTAAERRERAEREFVSNAAHELRTPLAAIVGAVEVLQAGAKDEPAERDRFLAHLERQCRRLERLTSALLVLARVQTGAEEPRLEIVELCPLLEDLTETVHPSPRVRVEVACPEDLAVFATRELLEEALVNLLSNAAKYTRSGTIAIETVEREEVVEIVVRDTGRGMEPEDRERALERFYRGGNGDGGGFGLGLAIAAEAVKAMGSRLELHSTPGGGTTARMFLRAARVVAA
jgi:two-component system phosphate regulon sensor histidine kinase PhoR